MSVLALASVLLIPVIAYFLYWFSTPLRQTRGQPHAVSYEHNFYDTASKSEKPFPSVFEPASLKLSLIVPAYNEEERLPIMMDETMDFLKKEYKSGYEVIIIDDGSKDKTTAIGLKYTEKYGSDVVRVLTLKKNQGKGGAVQQGMLHARGEYLLMVDADGATTIDDLSKVHKGLKEAEQDGHGIAVGSRAHLAERAAAERKWYRNVLMYGFHFAVSFIGGIWNIKDTQCGFKLFTRRTAQFLFFNQRLRRWCFDVELLQLALRHGKIPMVEVGVRWREIPGSKLNLLESSFLMARDLVVIRLAYFLHIWTADQPPSNVTELKQTAASLAARAKAA